MEMPPDSASIDSASINSASIDSASTMEGARAPLQKERWVGLDLLRLFALVMMIEGHVFSTCLSKAYQGQMWLRWHRFAHGFTAPAFFFASGLAFGVATYGQWPLHLCLSAPAPRKRLLKYAFLVAIALCFQLQPHVLAKLLQHPFGDVALPIGALNLIAASLITAQLMVPMVRRQATLAWAALLLAAALLILSPWVWQNQLEDVLPPLLGAWFGHRWHSTFPLFPWAAYIFLGIACAHLLGINGARRTPSPHRVAALGLAGSALSGTLLALWALQIVTPRDPYFWRAHPPYVLFRLGIVGLLVALCTWWADNLKSQHRLTAWMSGMSRETLTAYVIHIIVVYSSPLGPGLMTRVGPSLSMAQTLALSFFVVVLTLVLTHVWATLKRKSVVSSAARATRWAILGLFIGAFAARSLPVLQAHLIR